MISIGKVSRWSLVVGMAYGRLMICLLTQICIINLFPNH